MRVKKIEKQATDDTSYGHLSKLNLRLVCRKSIASFLCLALVLSINVVSPKKAQAAVKLSKSKMTVKQGTKKTLTLSGAKASKVSWKSTNPFCGKVSKGVFTASYAGRTKVVASYGGKSYTCKVYVQNKYRTIYLNKKKVTISDKGHYTLKATATSAVKYHSCNEHIAKVNSKGKIVGVNPGKTVIVAKTGSAYAYCKVKVKSAGANNGNFAKWLYSSTKETIRCYNSKGKFVYYPLCMAKGKKYVLGLANVKSNTIKKVVWSSSDKSVADISPKGKHKATVSTLKHGKTKISAVVFYDTGESTLFTNTMHVSDPKPNTKTVVCFTSRAGSKRHQYISFSGLNPGDKVKYTIPKTKKISAKVSKNKCKILGKSNGKGTIKAKVDGKTFSIKYYVATPKFGSIIGVLAKGNTTKIKIGGLGSMKPVFTSRNTSVASVAVDGTITGRGSGVTYVDVKLGSMTFAYRVEVAAKGIKTIINRAKYIVNNWTYSQPRRMSDGYYDCSALVWKGYKAYKNYNVKLGSSSYALPAASLFDYLRAKKQIVSFGFTKLDDLRPGDLFFYGDYSSAVKYSTPGRTLNIYHVAMYAGNGRVVEKGTPKYTYNSLDHIVGVGRVVY